MMIDTFIRHWSVLIPVSLLIFTVNCIFLWKMIKISLRKPEILSKSRKDIAAVSVFSFFQFFLSFLGVPAFAGGSVFYSRIKCVSTKKLPGTLNASAAIPAAVLALVLITRIEMDPITLIVAVITQTLGAAFTPQLVSKTQVKTIRKLLALGVVIAGTGLLMTVFQIPENMDIGLRGYKLVIFGLMGVLYGALNNFGIGSFTLMSFMVYLLGLNPAAAVPVLVCASAVSIPVASIRFIKLEMVSSSVSLLSTIAGAAGVWAAAFFFDTITADFRILGAVFLLCAIAMFTDKWWKNRKQPLDTAATDIRITAAGLYFSLAAGVLIAFEFVYVSYRELSQLYNAVVQQRLDAFIIKEFIAHYGSAILIISFFASSVLIGLARVLIIEISDHDETKALSLTDPLTGLANRRAFNARLFYEWNRLVREHAPISNLMLEVDHFKKYNDTYGHPQGDELLKSLAGVAKGFARRPTDIAARLGGEEFGVLLPGCNLENAAIFAENLRSKIEQMRVPMIDGGEPAAATASIGVAAIIPSNDNPCESLIKIADSMLYKAKQSGRNKICVNDTEEVN